MRELPPHNPIVGIPLGMSSKLKTSSTILNKAKKMTTKDIIITIIYPWTGL